MQDFATFNLIDTATAVARERERTLAANRHSLEYRRLTADVREPSLVRKLIAGPNACGHSARIPAASAG